MTGFATSWEFRTPWENRDSVAGQLAAVVAQRLSGTVDSVDDLEEATLTVCDHQVQYRANFENDPFLDSGWIMNNINCSGYDDNGTYNYVIVHETDPRYKGDPDWAIWGTWEYHVLTESGVGNLVRRPGGPTTP